MNQVLEWLKANVAIIVFTVVIIASLVTLPIFAGSMNESVRAEVETRSRSLGELGRIERTSVNLPTGETFTGVVNDRFLDMYREYVKQTQEDAQEVLDAALAFNRRDHHIIDMTPYPELFPEPPREQRDILPRHFHDRLIAAYDDLLLQLGVGMPPSGQRLAEELNRRELQFRSSVLLRDANEPLDAEERKQLEAELRNLRLIRYQEAAQDILFYFDRALLNLPSFDSGRRYELDELFEWQWRLWIHRDILGALASANRSDGTVIRGPVKRVAALQIAPRQDVGSAASINPRAAVQPDYSISLTGRRSNHLYDVRMVDLELIVDSQRMFEVMDAVSAYNFMTVVNAEVSETNPYHAARAGVYYGEDQVVRLRLQVETVWFRKWTSERMPQSTLQALGIQERWRSPDA